jgi:succinate-acetate transporter protein
MDITTMSTAMVIACVFFGLLLITFLVLGIAAAIKYLWSPKESRALLDTQRLLAGSKAG